MEMLEMGASILPVGQHSVFPDLKKPIRPWRILTIGPAAPLIPGKILFGAMTDRRLRFRRPIQLEIYREDDLVVARACELDEFGCGANISEALEDIGKTLAEEYVFLHEQADHLSDDLRNHFRTLAEFIEFR